MVYVFAYTTTFFAADTPFKVIQLQTLFVAFNNPFLALFT